MAAGDAETVYEKVKEVLVEEKIDLQKVIGLGSDGASGMCDKHSGVGVCLPVVCVGNTVVWVCACLCYVWETQWCGCVPACVTCGKHSGVGVHLPVICVINKVVWVFTCQWYV